jgi:hypothetical protein
MPIRVGKKDAWQTVTPTSEWQTLKTPLTKDEFGADTDYYYVVVNKT